MSVDDEVATPASAGSAPETEKMAPKTEFPSEGVPDTRPAENSSENPAESGSDTFVPNSIDLGDLSFISNSDDSDKKYLDSILATVVQDKDGAQLRKAYSFFRSGNMLTGPEWGIWKAFLQARAGKFIPSKEFILSYLTNHRKEIEKSSKYKSKDYEPISGDNYLGFIDTVSSTYDKLSSEESLNNNDFNQNLELFKDSYASTKTKEIFQDGLNILSDGLRDHNNVLHGVNDAQDYVKKYLNRLTSTVDSTAGSGYLSAQEVEDTYEKDESLKIRHLFDIPGIPTFNEKVGGFKTHTLVTVIAPEKGGKTKFCAMCAHAALVNGVNTSILSLEDGAYEFETQVRAKHFDYYYNTGKSLADMKTGVSAETIQLNDFPTEELREAEHYSDIDMKDASNGYGNLEYIDNNRIDSTDIIDIIEGSIKHNNSDFVIIDYPKCLPWFGIFPSEREMLETVYKELLQCAKRNNVCILAPAQMTQEAIKGIAKTGIDNYDLRTAAGGSAEITRSPDLLFTLYGTVQDIEGGRLKLIPMPSRRSPAFGAIDLHVDFATCSFIEVKNS